MAEQAKSVADNILLLRDAVVEHFKDVSAISFAIKLELKGAFSTPGPGGRQWIDPDRPISERLNDKLCYDPTTMCSVSELIEAVVCREIDQALPNILSNPDRSDILLGMPFAIFQPWLFGSGNVDVLIDAVYAMVIPTVGSFTLRSFFVREPNEMGFLLHDRRDEEEWDYREGVAKKSLDLGDGILLDLRRRNLEIEYDDLCRGHLVSGFIEAANGKRLGYIQGYLLHPSVVDLSEGEFFNVCDSVDQRLTDLGGALMSDHKSVHRILSRGSLLFLSEWEVATEMRGSGLGWRALAAYLGSLKRSFRGLNTIVTEFAPAQFYLPFKGSEPPELQAEYEKSASKIKKFWETIAPHDMLGVQGRTFEIRIRARRSPLEQLRLLAENTEVPFPFADLESGFLDESMFDPEEEPSFSQESIIERAKYSLDQFRGFGVKRDVEEAIPALEESLAFLEALSLLGDEDHTLSTIRSVIHLALGEYNSGSAPEFDDDIPACIKHFKKASELGSAHGAFNAAFMMIWKGEKPLDMHEVERLYNIVQKSGDENTRSEMKRLGHIIQLRHRKVERSVIIEYIGHSAKLGDKFCDAMLRHLDTVAA
jgi:hypothetical protein